MTVPVPYFEDFEGGPSGWAQSAFTVYCQWEHITDPELIEVHPDIYGDMVVLGDPAPARLPSAHSGRSCWWYGNPENGTFIGEPFDHTPLTPLSGGNSEVDHGGHLTSPLFETTSMPSITFSFWTWWEVECIDIDQFDMMFIEASSDGGATWDTLNWLNPPFARLTGWDEYESYSSGGWLEPGVWIKWTYFLDHDWTGHDVMIRFEFDTQDPLYNGFRGWMIDDFYIGGGIEEPHLYREGDHPESLSVIDCEAIPNPFPFEYFVTNVGGEVASDVVLDLNLPPSMSISSGLDIVTLGTVLPNDSFTTNWELLIDSVPESDTSICWEVLLTSADSLIGFKDNFEGGDPLFSGEDNFYYCDVRRPGGPEEAISGLGVAGIPATGDSIYGFNEHATLTSTSFNLTGWTEAYISFWYWLDVHFDPMWTDDGEDGFLVEYQIDGGTWEQLDEFGVGLLIPRYDAYIDELSTSSLANKMAYCKSTEGEWVEVVSQDLIDMGVFSPGEEVRFRFVFASNNVNHGEGLFIDDFRLSTHQYPVGPYLHTFCIDIPGLHRPYAELIMPLDSTSSSCPDQELVVNTGGEALIDTYAVVIWADGTTRFAVDEGNMIVDSEDGIIIAQPPSPTEYWTEGWHSLTLDTCFNILGCNLDSSLSWSFLSDFTPPNVTLIDPPGGTFYGEVSSPVTVTIRDTLLGVDQNTLSVIYCGDSYEYPHSAVSWDGLELTFYPESTGTGLTWEDCGEFCVVAGDEPDYCEPNIDTTCFPITIDYSVPWANLVSPPPGAISACPYQEIVIALFDSAGIQPDGIEFVVNGVRHVSGISSEISVENDTLTYTPFMRWIHGDTVEFALELFYNIHGTPNEDTIRSTFISDLEPPQVTPLSPQPGQLLTALDVHIDAGLRDLPAGIKLSSIELLFMGRDFEFAELEWSGVDTAGNIGLEPSIHGLLPTWGDTFAIEITVCDDPDYCEANCTTFVWDFHMEPQTNCAALPNPFSPNGDNINDLVLLDYPHRYIEQANLKIFSIDNILVYEKQIGAADRIWRGTDNFGSELAPGLYIYIIESEGRIICNGTIVLVR